MKLYALCDQELLDSKNISITDFIKIAIKNGAEIIQYRNKKDNTDIIKNSLILIKNLFDGIVIVNDNYSLVQYCDGVHLGQEDLFKIDTNIFNAIKIVRDKIGEEKLLGISTHNKKEVLEANIMELDYIGLGAYRNTSTKNISNILGDDVENIASFSKHPVGVIGGVRKDDKFKNITYHVIGSGLL